ncbi:MAG: hypothetical protein K2W99_00790 [Chthoniobacterales bacterium]|nr:hypothetical protein [Chthoniobacterales bacterium]
MTTLNSLSTLKIPSSLQTIIALTLVVLTVIGFLWRWWQRRNKLGCGGGCCCSSTILKKPHATSLEHFK